MSVRVFFSANLKENQKEILKKAGFEPVSISLIKTVPLEFSSEEVLKFSPDFTVISSKNGVKHFFSRISPEKIRNSKFIAVGSSTAEKLKEIDIEPLVPENFSGEGLVELLKTINLTGKRFLIVRPKVARKVVSEFLREKGAEVKEVVVYETIANEDIKEDLIVEIEKGFEILAFTSPSNFKSFLNLTGEKGKVILNEGKIIPIGHVTQKAIEKLGFKTWKLPLNYTIDGILNLILQGGSDANREVS
ncbi:uroporphyrinogen-III synthase [Desulfurobacterium thermolithotrophum]|uniref:uroporphyrinogen-III synthase n=1 Tax=Desulfurobacterium thermolithotrophum TaxID=64160 RepID=UPI0013D5C4C3|nr:uroporphyrinogen-III synthase [Desulfurobacterium thermolithotrophum]